MSLKENDTYQEQYQEALEEWGKAANKLIKGMQKDSEEALVVVKTTLEVIKKDYEL